MKKSLSLYLIFSLFLFQISCASIVSGRHQDISVRSNPPGALVEIDGMQMGKTPVTTEVKRKKRHQIKIMKDGYLEETRMTKKGYNWWFTGNVIIGGIIGIIIDFATGAVYSVSPDEMNVTLVQKEGASPRVEVKEKTESSAELGNIAAVDAKIVQIEKLNDLKNKGLLTPEEFAKQKQQVLGE